MLARLSIMTRSNMCKHTPVHPAMHFTTALMIVDQSHEAMHWLTSGSYLTSSLRAHSCMHQLQLSRIHVAEFHSAAAAQNPVQLHLLPGNQSSTCGAPCTRALSKSDMIKHEQHGRCLAESMICTGAHHQAHTVHPRHCHIASSRMMLLACKSSILDVSPEDQIDGTHCHKHTAC